MTAMPFLAFLAALVVGLALGQPVLALLRRLRAQQIISSDAPERHQTKAGTPSMGGLIFLIAALAGAFFAGRISADLLALAAVTIAFAAIGFLDDLLIILRGKNLGLKARQKLALQFIFGLFFVLWVDRQRALGVGETRTYQSIDGLLLLFHLLLIVGMSNAVNLTDGLDGLAAGLAVPLWLTLAFIAQVAPQITGREMVGSHDVVAFCAAFAGACLAFLWFNSHPASVFMGDTGSLALGGGMAGAAILMQAEWAMLLAGGVYLAEAASVALQVASFKTTGRRIFRMSPLHHHFELVGWKETRIVARFTIVGVALAAVTLLWLLG